MIIITDEDNDEMRQYLESLKSYNLTKKSRPEVTELIRKYHITLRTHQKHIAISTKLNSMKQNQST